eukprot:TRINITY_DN119_c0_g1_i1.p1 TRINITY_DN119_c0_g1~~TRINITY_DN119_c0_g1_i1.p1  ORF type:complete len:253 (-),score=39.91 TRINITY_DN119_c0_g1_i1:94-852(-)
MSMWSSPLSSVDSRWGNSPWSFGATFSSSSSSSTPVVTKPSRFSPPTASSCQSLSSTLTASEDDYSMMEYQALATLRELSIPLENNINSKNKSVDPISKRLSMEERSHHQNAVGFDTAENSLSPSSSSSSDSLSSISSSSDNRSISPVQCGTTSPTTTASVHSTCTTAAVTSVFIGRLPFDLSDDEFHSKLDIFLPQDCCICMNKRKKSKGFGFATFENEQQATKFVEYANNAYLFTHQKLPLRVEICTREH